MITITEAAQAHFRKLLEKQNDPDMQLRIEAIDPNGSHPECGIRFFKADKEQGDDIVLGFKGFMLYVDAKSIPYLQGAYVDFKKDGLNGELYMETPNLKPRGELNPEWPIQTKVQFLLDTEINPQVAAHGGMVSVVDVSEDNVVILRFGGGCQGCGMIDMTLKNGVEKVLKERIPEITEVRDVTDHTAGKNPYY
ncbi:MAG: NifU family protein [Pseudomonadota bacterium]